MVSLLSSLNMTANTLSVNEKAISVVSHNVANMNTEGYHKQRVNLQTRNIAGAIGYNVYNEIEAYGGVNIAIIKIKIIIIIIEHSCLNKLNWGSN